MKTTPTSVKGKIAFAITFIALLFAGLTTKAQVTTPDTVCSGSVDVVYGVMNSSPTSKYYWGISNPSVATIDSSIAANDSIINIDYDFLLNPDSLELWVYEISADGCIGDTVKLPIYIRESPLAELDSSIVCHGDSAFFTINFLTGVAPWTFEYSIDGGNTTLSETSNDPSMTVSLGVQTNQTGGQLDVIVDLISLQDGHNCDINPDDLIDTRILVNPQPQTQAIYHY